MKKLTALTILALLTLTALTSLTYAATEFVSTVAPSGGDYTSLASWQANNQCDLTTSRVMSHGSITGAIADGAYVKGATSGGYGTVVHATSTQICVKTITNTFQSGETIDVTGTLNGSISGTGSVVSSTAPDSVIAVAKIDGDWTGAPDTSAVALTGWTTAAANYIKIYTTPAARHSGKWNTSAYILSVTAGANSAIALNINANFVTVEGLQVLLTSAGYTGCKAINIDSQSAAATITIQKNILQGAISGSSPNGEGIGLYANNANITGNFYNNIAYNFKNGANANSAGIATATGGTYNLYNNTVYGNLTGISIGAGTITAKNNIANANTTDYSGTIATHATNLSQDSTSPDGASYQGANGTASFVSTTSGSEDFHLQSGDTKAKNTGTSLATIFLDDIEGIIRSGTWDIGASEFGVVWLGTTSTNWETAGNWSTGVKPGANDTAIFNATSGAHNCDLGADIASLGAISIVNGYTGALSQGAYNLTLSNYSQTGGTFTGSSNAAKTMTITLNYVLYGGTFNGGSGAITTNSNGVSFRLSGGTFNSTSGNLSISKIGIYKSVAATFSPGTGTVTCIDVSQTFNVNGSLAFNNLTIADSGNGISITSGNILIVNGTFTSTSGGIWTGIIDAKGPISVASTAGTGQSGKIIIDGASSQSFTIPNGAGMPAITLNQSATTISVANGATVTFAGSATDPMFTITAGTFDGGQAAAVNLVSGLTMTGGTFIAPSGNLNIQRRALNTSAGGTFDATTNSGTVTFTELGGTIDVNGSLTFNNLTINRSSQSLTIATGDTLVVNGTLTLTGGGSVLGGTINAKGAVSVSATFPSGSTTAIQLTGTADQAVTIASGGVVPTGLLTVNNPGHVATITGTTSAAKPLAGGVTVSAGTLTFGPGAYYFTAGTTLNVASGATCNFAGTDFSNMVTLRSSAASVWNLTKTGTVTANFTDVQYSNASADINATNSANSGNNTHWLFDSGNANTWISDTGKNWSDTTAWSKAAVPGSNDVVYFAGAHVGNCTIDAAVNVAAINMTPGYTGTVTAGSGSVQRNIVTSGNVIIAGGTLTHAANTTAETYKLNLTVGGNLTVASGGAISADGMGYSAGNGPGQGLSAYNGASYGGVGGWKNTGISTIGTTYGSITAPTNLGSGANVASGGSGGGGAVILSVTGTSSIYGTISANGATGSNISTGSGGSAFITTGAIAGSGTIQANGGASSPSGNLLGGGGRVAVILISGNNFDSVSMTAYGGANTSNTPGGAGTVYKQTQAQGTGNGNLIINNNSLTASVGSVTDINSLCTDTTVGNLTIQSSGILHVNAGGALTLAGTTWTGVTSSTMTANAGSTITLTGTGTYNIPNITNYGNLTLNNAAATFTLPAATTVAGKLTQTAGTIATGAYALNVIGDWIGAGNTVSGSGAGAVNLNGGIGNGCVGYWKMDETSGTVVSDSSSLAITGTNSGATIVTTGTMPFAGDPAYLSFNGANSNYVDLGTNSSLNITGTLSVAFWIKTTNAVVGTQAIVANALADNTANYAVTFGKVTAGKIDFWNSNAGVNITSATAVNDGNWHHVVCTRSGTTGNWNLAIYKDGVLDKVVSTVNNPNNPASPSTAIGRYGAFTSTNYYLTASLDDVRIYNRVLSMSEIAALAAGKQPYQKLLGSTTFYNLTKSVTAADTTYFQGGQTQSIMGALTLSGAAGQLLSLRSCDAAGTQTDATQWMLDIYGTSTVGYVDAKDSDASWARSVSAPNSTDSGNNLNWTFDTAANTTRWLGGTSAAWATAGNWSNGVPTNSLTAIIDGAGTYQPSITSAASAKAVYVSGTPTLTLTALLTVVNDVKLYSGAAIDASGAGGAISVGGNYTQSGGTFTGGATNCTMSGNTVLTGGTFTAPTTVIFNGAASTITANNQAFNAITVSKNDGTALTIAGGTTITANGTLTLTDGAIGTGTINAKSAVSAGAGFDGGSGTLKIGGTGSQSIASSGGTLPNVEINQTGTFTLGNDIIAGGAWTYTTSGGFSANSKSITFTGAATFTPGNASYYDIIVNETSTGNALIVSGTAAVTHNLTLTEGMLNTGTITIGNNLTLGGANFTGGTAALQFTGTTAQAITIASGGVFPSGAVTVNNAAGVTSTGAWTIPGAVTINGGTLSLGDSTTFQNDVTISSGGMLSCTQGGKTLRFKQAKTLTVNSGGFLTLNGASGSLLTLTNNTGDTTNLWKINAVSGSVYNIDYVSAYYSSANTYPTIYTSSASTVDASCVNWDNSGSTWTWVGGATGATTDWNTAANWSPASVPGAGADVSIPLTTYKPTLPTSTTIKSLSIDIAPAKLTCSAGANLIVTGTATLTNGGELKLNSTTFTCGGNADFSGGTLTQDTSTIAMNSSGSATLTLPAADAVVDNLTFSGAGTFGFGNAGVTVTGVWTQSAGTVNAPTGTLTFTTSGLTTSGGTFNPGTGTATVAFTGAGADQTINANAQAFNNLTTNKPGYNLIITGGTSIDVNGTLTLTDGSLNTGTVNAKGAVSAAATFDGGTASLILNGAGAQTFTLAAGSVLPNTTFNNANLSVTPAGSLSFYGLALTAGTYHSSSYATTITTGNFTVSSGGTFDEGTGTAVFTGAGADQTITANTQAFNNLTTNKPGYNLIIASGTSVTTNGTLTLTDGSLNTGLMNVKGAVSIAATFDGGTSPVTINGTSAQAITIGSGGTFTSGAFTVNKNSGTATSSGAWTIPGTTTITKGALSTGAATTFTGAVTVSSGGTLSAASDAVFSNTATVSSYGALSVTGAATFSNTCGGAGTFTFAGDTTFNDAVTITSGGTFSHTTGGKTIKFKENKAVNINSGATINLIGASGSLITLDRVGSADQWSLTMNGSYEFSYLDAANSFASANVYATSSVDHAPGGTNTNWNFTDSVTWTGTGSTDWATKANWSPQVIPGSGTNILIPNTSSGSGRNPILGSATTIKTLTIQTGGQLTLGANLTTTGNILNSGALLPQSNTINCGGDFNTGSGAFTYAASTLNMNGSGTPTVTLGVQQLYSFTMSGSGTLSFADTDVTVNGAWTRSAGAVTAPGGTLTFAGNDSAANVASSQAFNGLAVAKNSGKTLTISGQPLIANGTLTLTSGAAGTGTLDAKAGVSVGASFGGGNAALTLDSTSADQAITVASGGVMPTGDLTINKTGRTAAITGACTLNNVTLSAGVLTFTPGYTYAFAAGKTLNVGSGTTLNFVGTSGSNRVTLRSGTPTSEWYITKTGAVNALYVDVQDSHASDTIVANNSIDSGRNTNWFILTLNNWDLDLSANPATLTMIFGSAVNVGTLNANQNMTIQNQSGSASYVFTGGTTNSSNGTTLVMNITSTDLNAIKANPNLAKSAVDSYITITSSLITGTTGALVNEITTPKQVRNYTADNIAPVLSSWALDMNAHTLTLNFNESVKATSWTPAAVTLQDAASSPAKTYALTSGSTTASPDGTAIVVGLSVTDYNALVDYSGGGLCDTQGHSYLTMMSSAITDMATTPNSVTAVTTGVQASYAAQIDSPTKFRVTVNDAYSTSTTPAIAIGNVTIKAYDPAGYRCGSYAGSKTLIFSGANDSPDPVTHPKANSTNFGSDTALTFANGKAAATITLYKREAAVLKAAVTGSIDTDTIYALTVTVNPGLKNKLAFTQQPSPTPAAKGIINVPLGQQPIIEIRDYYGNRTADVDTVTLLDSSAKPIYHDITGGDLANASIAAVDGTATFTGLAYSKIVAVVYIEATAVDVNSVWADSSIEFTASGTGTVDAVAPADRIGNFPISSINDDSAHKFPVLRFKVTDAGSDLTDTLVDYIKIAVGVPSGGALSDIGGAAISKDRGATFINKPVTIANGYITFGTDPNNADSTAAFDTVGEGTSAEYTVYIYMKNSKLAATEGQAFTFGVNESLIGVDTGTSSQMAAAQANVTAVTGTITVAITHLEVVTSGGAITTTGTAGMPIDLMIMAVDRNKNIDIDYGGVNGYPYTLKFYGLNPSPNTTSPMISGANFGSNITINFVNGVSGTGAAVLTAANAETGTVEARQYSGSTNLYSAYTLAATIAAGTASTITATGGDGQTGKTSKALPTLLKIDLTDNYGNPKPGATVTFTPSGTASVSSPPPVTNSSGQATTTLTLGSVDGAYTVGATTGALSLSPSFTATGRTPRGIYIVSGNSPTQTKVINLALDSDFVAKLVDVATGDGNAVPNETVTFAITSPTGIGSLSFASGVTKPMTDANPGQVSTRLTFGNVASDYIVHAGYSGLNGADFTATATSPGASKIILTGPSTITAGSASQAFTITTKDAFNNIIALNTATSFDLTGSYLYDVSTRPGGGRFYSDSGCTTQTSQVTIGAGSSSTQFYYKQTDAATITATATRATTTPAGQLLPDGSSSTTPNITVVPAGLSYFIVSAANPTDPITAGAAKTITVTAYDVNNNPCTNLGTANIKFKFADGAAHTADDGTAPICGGAAFGSAVSLTFSGTTGAVNASLLLYKPETAATAIIKAYTDSGADTTDARAQGLIVMHAAADHVKFAGNLPSSPSAGTLFNFDTTALNVVDRYGNVCGNVGGGTPYTFSKDIVWSLVSPAVANGPDGLPEHTDTYVTPVNFTNGVSTTALSATLYRAQTAQMKADITAGLGHVVASEPSNTMTVGAGGITKLTFDRQPSLTCITSQLLAIQPRVAVGDAYGNPCTNTPSGSTITISAVTDKGSDGPPVVPPTAARNGTLRGTTTQAISGGLATFTNLTYDYPETIYLQVAVDGVSLAPKFSTPITFSTTTDLSTAAFTNDDKTANGITGSISSAANITAAKACGFKVTDAGVDGRDGLITKIIIHRSASDTTGDWTTYIGDAWITDVSASPHVEHLCNVTANSISYDGGVNPIFTVPNNNVSSPKIYILSLTMKSSLPAGADGKVMGFTMNANSDLTVDSVLGSSFGTMSAIADTSTVAVTATDLKITGSPSSIAAGGSVTLTIKAVDANGNIDRNYVGTSGNGYTGDKGLTFTGASVSSTGTSPTCKDNIGTARNFGVSTLTTFTNGVSTTINSQLTMNLYKAEVAVISVTDAAITSSAAGRLTVTVSGGAASTLFWNTQPVAYVVAMAPWKQFVVSVADAYGNTSSSIANVELSLVDPTTGLPSGVGTIHPSATASVAAVAGTATFNNFFVTCSAYPGSVALKATAPSEPGVTASVPSNAVQVDQLYQVNMAVKDSVTSTALSGVSFKVQQTVGGVTTTVYGPVVGNSPFAFTLPYGTYTFMMTLDKYLDFSAEEVVGVSADGGDGVYDNVINWTRYMTTMTEATADYRVMSSFVYDEDNDSLYIRLWLERRGKLILNSGINLLGVATVDVYDDANRAWLFTVPLIPPTGLVNGTYMLEVPNVTASDSNSFHKALTSGKTYFAQCRINYGGLLGDGTLYEAGATFTITNLQKVGNEIISKLGVPAGETLGGMVTAVQTGVNTVSGKIDTVSGKVDTVSGKVDTVTSKIDTVSSNVTAVGSNVTAILSDVTTTLPAQITQTVTAQAEKGIMSEILTRNSLIRVGDSIMIRYRTQPGLAPTMTLYDSKGSIVTGYNAVPMVDISNATGIYERQITSGDDWAVDDAVDYTIVCSEPILQSKDSMILTVAPLFIAGATLEQTVENVGYAVTRVYSRAGTIQTLLGQKTDTSSANTVMGQVNGLNSTIKGLNLTSVASDSKEARMNALKAADDIGSIKDQFSDMQTRMDALKDLNSQLEALKASLGKVSEGSSTVAGVSVATSAVAGVGMATPVSAGGGISGGGLSPEEVVMTGGKGPRGEKIAIKISKGEIGPGGVVKGTGKEALIQQPGGITSIMTGDFARQNDIKEVSNKVEELTALTKIITKLIESSSNKPVVEGWFEKE